MIWVRLDFPKLMMSIITNPLKMTTQKPRVQISRDDFLKTFATLYNEHTEHAYLDTIPELMEK